MSRMQHYTTVPITLCTLSLQETGNRMTERNLATILGPNILHRELKVCVAVASLDLLDVFA